MLDLWLPKQSVPITTKVVSSNPTHGEVYSIQHYVIKLVTLATGQWFSPSTPVSSTNKIDHHNITEILLKMALNTITLTVTRVDYFITVHSSTPLIGGLRGSNVLLFIGSGKRVDLFHIFNEIHRQVFCGFTLFLLLLKMFYMNYLWFKSMQVCVFCSYNST